MSEAPAFRPLEGVRVLEVAQNLAGPFCGRILADLGAEVVKVEPPEGDAARHWGPPFHRGNGTIFGVANTGKRFLTLDLHDDGHRETLFALADASDVLVEALRPGAFAGLGFDWATLHARNPRLILASVLAYGEEGPLADLPGYDALMQAHGGIMSYTGEPGGEEVRVGTSVVDYSTGMWCAIGVLAALREREGTGRGRRVSAALFDTALALGGYHLLGALADGTVPGRAGSGLPMICPYGAFEVADGRVMIAVGNDAIFARFCSAVGLEALLADPGLASNRDRVAHRAEVEAAVHAATRRFDRDGLLAVLRAAGVPAAPILDVGEVLADPQTRASGMLAGAEGAPDHVVPALPLRIDGIRPSPGAPPPERPRIPG